MISHRAQGSLRIVTFVLVGIAALISMCACSTTASVPDASSGIVAPPTPIPTIDIVTYRATVDAVMATMPTYTPLQSAEGVAGKYQDAQRNELYQQAVLTVVAMQHLIPIMEPNPTPEPITTLWPGPR